MSILARMRRRLAEYGLTLGAICLLLAVVSVGAAGYVYLNPPVEQIPAEEYDIQTFEAAVDDSATVTAETPLYEPNQTLRNQPVYFLASTPNVTFHTSVSVPQDREVNISYQLLLYNAAEFNDEVFWERKVVLNEGRTTVTDGRFRTNTSLNVSSYNQEISDIEQRVAAVSSVSTELRLQTSYTSPAEGGGTYEGTLSDSAPLQISDNTYYLGGDLSDSETQRQQTEPRTREAPVDMGLVGMFGFVGLGLAALGISIGWWSQQQPDVKQLEIDVHREKYDEWISEGEFPTDTNAQYVYVASLEDLVDIAIDTDKRVIYDPELTVYSVLDEQIIYYYASDPGTIKQWLGFKPSET